MERDNRHSDSPHRGTCRHTILRQRKSISKNLERKGTEEGIGSETRTGHGAELGVIADAPLERRDEPTRDPPSFRMYSARQVGPYI